MVFDNTSLTDWTSTEAPDGGAGGGGGGFDPSQLPLDQKVKMFCVKPWLAPSKYETINTAFGELPCYLYCGKEQSHVTLKPADQGLVLALFLSLGIVTLVAGFLLCFNFFYQHLLGESAKYHQATAGPATRGTRVTVTSAPSMAAGAASPGLKRAASVRNAAQHTVSTFRARPFSFDVSLCVTVGALLTGFAQLAPFMSGHENIVCRENESFFEFVFMHIYIKSKICSKIQDTYVTDVPHTFHAACFINGNIYFAGIHILFAYQTALCVSLWRKLYRPMASPDDAWLSRRMAHVAIYCWVLLWCVVASATESFGGNAVTGMCHSGQFDRNAFLVATVIPANVYMSVSAVFSGGTLWLLRKHLQAKREDRQMSQFVRRFGLYSVLCTVSCTCFAYVSNHLYRYNPKYGRVFGDYIACRVAKQVMNPSLRCPRKDTVPVHIFIMVPMLACGLTLAGLVLSFNSDNIRMWRRCCWERPREQLANLKVMVANSITFNGAGAQSAGESAEEVPTTTKTTEAAGVAEHAGVKVDPMPLALETVMSPSSMLRLKTEEDDDGQQLVDRVASGDLITPMTSTVTDVSADDGEGEEGSAAEFQKIEMTVVALAPSVEVEEDEDDDNGHVASGTTVIREDVVSELEIDDAIAEGDEDQDDEDDEDEDGAQEKVGREIRSDSTML